MAWCRPLKQTAKNVAEEKKNSDKKRRKQNSLIYRQVVECDVLAKIKLVCFWRLCLARHKCSSGLSNRVVCRFGRCACWLVGHLTISTSTRARHCVMCVCVWVRAFVHEKIICWLINHWQKICYFLRWIFAVFSGYIIRMSDAANRII